VTYIAIDPGPVQSGIVRILHGQLLEAGTYPNEQILASIHPEQVVIVEWLQSYGAAIGQSVLRTAQFCGEIRERCRAVHTAYHEMTRPEVLRELVGKTRGISKAVVRRAVIDLYPQTGGGSNPEIGTKTNPGPLFKMRGANHAWDALALLEAWKKVQI
jgi:hypothetical protein